MNSNDLEQEKDSNVVAKKSVRRKFLQRATIGVAIATIPGRTAWAGLVNSIVASAQGSEFATAECLQVLSPGYWLNHDWIGVSKTLTFNEVFQGLRFKGSKDGSNASIPDVDDTLIEILNQPGNKKMGGPSNVNFHLVGMFLNGAHHGLFGIHFPVLQSDGGPFANLDAYANYLYAEASANPGGTGVALSQIVDDYHVGGSSIC